MSEQNRRLPTHRAYAVIESNGRRHWREIGAAWTHADGDGLTVKLDCVPVNGGEIVIRKPTVEKDAVASEVKAVAAEFRRGFAA